MIKISADSTCDLSPELRERFQIAITPLSIVVGEQVFRDGVDIHPADVFRFVDEADQTCQTGAVNLFEYQEHFEKLSKKNNAIIHISLGSGFSSCYSNALLAARDFPNVYVVDSQNLSTGMGHLVYDAALFAKEGIEPAEIKNRLETLVPKVEASFVMDRLEYMAKGGRCSAITAQSAKFLRLKPCIEVRDGAMIVGRKYRGNFEKSVLNYVKDRLKDRDDIDYSRVFITSADCDPSVVEAVRQAVLDYGPFEEVLETSAGCTISNHCGPNTLGVLFKRL